MSGIALAVHQFRYDQKTFWRNPASVFFTVMFPVIFLFIFELLFGNDLIRSLGVKTSTYYVPAIITLAVFSATFQSARGAPRCRGGCSSPGGSATRWSWP